MKGTSGITIVAAVLIAVIAMVASVMFLTVQKTTPTQYYPTYDYTHKQLAYTFIIRNGKGQLMTNDSVKVVVFTDKPMGFDKNFPDQALLSSPQDSQGNTITPYTTASVDEDGKAVVYLQGGKTYYIVFEDVQPTQTEYWSVMELKVPAKGTEKPSEAGETYVVSLKDIGTIKAYGDTSIDVSGTGTKNKVEFPIVRTITVADGDLLAKELIISDVNTGELGRIEVKVSNNKKVLYDNWLSIDNIPTNGDVKIPIKKDITDSTSYQITIKVDTLNDTAVSGDHKLSPGESVATVKLTDYAGRTVDEITITAE